MRNVLTTKYVVLEKANTILKNAFRIETLNHKCASIIIHYN